LVVIASNSPPCEPLSDEEAMFRPTSRILFVLALGLTARAAVAQLTVGAATELKPALEEVRRIYTERSGNPMRTIYATPAKLVAMAAQGSFDCILAPSEWIDSAIARGLAAGDASLQAESPLVVWSRSGGPLPDPELAFLLDTTVRGVAFSNPSESPDGARILPFLESLSADPAYRARWRIAADPAAALDTVLAGRADAALLPQSAVWSSPVAGMGRQTLLDSARAAPQRIQSIVLKVHPDRQANANGFLSWSQGPQGKGVWRRKGFLVP